MLKWGFSFTLAVAVGQVQVLVVKATGRFKASLLEADGLWERINEVFVVIVCWDLLHSCDLLVLILWKSRFEQRLSWITILSLKLSFVSFLIRIPKVWNQRISKLFVDTVLEVSSSFNTKLVFRNQIILNFCEISNSTRNKSWVILFRIVSLIYGFILESHSKFFCTFLRICFVHNIWGVELINISFAWGILINRRWIQAVIYGRVRTWNFDRFTRCANLASFEFIFITSYKCIQERSKPTVVSNDSFLVPFHLLVWTLRILDCNNVDGVHFVETLLVLQDVFWFGSAGLLNDLDILVEEQEEDAEEDASESTSIVQVQDIENIFLIIMFVNFSTLHSNLLECVI